MDLNYHKHSVNISFYADSGLNVTSPVNNSREDTHFFRELFHSDIDDSRMQINISGTSIVI